MKKTKNESYNRIIEYLYKNNNIEEDDRIYLIHYATQLYKNKLENSKEETLNDIYDSLKYYLNYYNTNLTQINETSITIERINSVITILEKICSKNITQEDINVISFQIDKLYYESDLPIRKKSSLSYNLSSIKKRNN